MGERRTIDKNLFMAVVTLLFAVLVQAGAITVFITQELEAKVHEIKANKFYTESRVELIEHDVNQIRREHVSLVKNIEKMSEALAIIKMMAYENKVLMEGMDKRQVRLIEDVRKFYKKL